MDFKAYHENKACDLVKEILDQCEIKMKELELRTLRIEEEPCILFYQYENGIQYRGLLECVVHGIHLTDDGLVMFTQPYSPTVKIINDCVTGPDCPEIDFEKNPSFIHTESDFVYYFSMLNLSTPISDAFATYEDKLSRSPETV